MAEIRPEQLYSSPDVLEQVLGGLMSDSTDVIKTAEKITNAFSKKVDCIAPLIQQIQQSGNAGVRLQAAILLKRKIGKLYNKLDPTGKANVHAALLNLCMAQLDAKVGTQVAGALAVIVLKVFKNKGAQWPEFFELLAALQNGDNSKKALLFELLEQCPTPLEGYMESLSNLLGEGCVSPDMKLAMKAMKATASFMEEFGSKASAMHLKKILPHMLGALEAAFQAGTGKYDVDYVSEMLEIFQAAAESQQPLINDTIPRIVPILVGVLQNFIPQNIDEEILSRAGQMLITLVEKRPKFVGKSNLVVPILEALVVILSSSDAAAMFQTPVEEEEGEDDEEDEMSSEQELNVMVQSTIDSMAIKIPSKYFAGPALNHVSSCIQSPDAKVRKGGNALLGVIIEGVADTLRPMLGQILPHVCNSMTDENVDVRINACFAIGQFSEHCQPEILSFADAILPPLLMCLRNAPNVKNVMVALYAIENFCESLEPEMFSAYLPTAMELLGAQFARPDKNIAVENQILCAISSIAVAAEKEFVPFVAAVVNVLTPYFLATEKNRLRLRGQALEVLGHIGVAVGESNFEPYFTAGLQCALESIQINDDDLSEYAYLYFCNAAKVMKSKIVPFLPQLIPILVQVVSQSEISTEQDEDDDYDDDDDEQYVMINVETGFVKSKKACVTALGGLAEAAREEMVPYYPSVIPALLMGENATVNSFHSEVKGETLEILPEIMSACLANENYTVKPGELSPMSENANGLAMNIGACYLEALEDEAMSVVASACSGVEKMLDCCGMSFLNVKLQSAGAFQEDMPPGAQPLIGSILTKLLINLLDGKAACQQEDKEHDQEEEEDDDHDTKVMDSVMDMVSSLAKAMGPNFEELAGDIFPRVAKYIAPKRIYSDKLMALGCFGECFSKMGEVAIKYFDSVMPLCQACILDPNSESLRRNSAFCIGNLCSAAAARLTQEQMNLVLTTLFPLVNQATVANHKFGEGGSDVDNAVSAALRIVTARQDIAPMDQVLPLALRAMPLKADKEEADSVFVSLMTLVDAGNAVALANLPRILEVIAEMAMKDLTADVATAIGEWKKAKMADANYVQAATALQQNNPAAFKFLSGAGGM